MSTFLREIIDFPFRYFRKRPSNHTFFIFFRSADGVEREENKKNIETKFINLPFYTQEYKYHETIFNI